MAYQTFVVHVLGVASIFIALIAGNIGPLGIENPWIKIVLIPGMVGAIYYAGNQMKSIGKPPSSTTKTITEETTTPPA